MSFTTFVPDILATIMGGLLLALIFFLLQETIYSLPNIDGSWTLTLKTAKTVYLPYKDMELMYLVLLWRQGNSVFGSAEKISEVSSQGYREYIGNDRSIATIDGHIQKNIFSPDRIVLHMKEENKARRSSTVHILEFKGKDIKGRFVSTIANQEGSSSWMRRSS